MPTLLFAIPVVPSLPYYIVAFLSPAQTETDYEHQSRFIMQTSHLENRDQYQADSQDKISLKIKSALTITSINSSSHARLPKGHV